MTSRRYNSAGISHAQSFIIFGGGSGKSTEIITEQGVSAGPEMPEAVSRHAVAVVNETTSILTGGLTDGIGLERFRHLNKTWFFNHVSQQFQTGPHLITGRYDHTSATIQDKVTMENIVAVFGGFKATISDAYLDSAELLINGESEWQQGKKSCKIKKKCAFVFLFWGCAFFSNMRLLFFNFFSFYGTFQVHKCQKSFDITQQ